MNNYVSDKNVSIQHHIPTYNKLTNLQTTQTMASIFETLTIGQLAAIQNAPVEERAGQWPARSDHAWFDGSLRLALIEVLDHSEDVVRRVDHTV